ncbi:MAG TPA: hypothetical protein VGH89_00465 [Pseudonocardia sp.]|jgi:uncharacterized membrane protein YhaH (DUF805 family)
MSSALGSQVPEAPQLVMPAAAQTVVTVIVAVVAVVALLAAAVLARRRHTPMYLLVLVGGAISSINEPVADLLGGIMHPRHGGWTVFATFDRPMPAWVVIAYGLFFGLVPLVVLELMRGGDPRSRLRRSIGVIFAANLLIELPVLASGMYVYYGAQPLFVLGLFPLHWLVINATGVAAIAVVLHRLGDRLRGARAVLLLVLPAMAQASALSVGVPAFSLYNSDAGLGWKWVGALLTVLLGVVALRALSGAVAGPVGPGATAPEPVGVLGR